MQTTEKQLESLEALKQVPGHYIQVENSDIASKEYYITEQALQSQLYNYSIINE